MTDWVAKKQNGTERRYSTLRKRQLSKFLTTLLFVVAVLSVCTTSVFASEDELTAEQRTSDAELSGSGGAAASNPISAVNNTDLKWTHVRLNDPNDSRQNDYWVRGGWTFARWLKLSYELTYRETNLTGSSLSDWESLSLKPIFFIKNGEMGSWKYRLATGFEWIVDFDNFGEGSDQISPLFGVALLPRKGTTLVPLVQHFVSYNGPTVNTTGFRLIGIQSLPYEAWLKMDLIVPYDWESERIPATLEIELGKMSRSFFGVYVSGITGIGGDAFVNWGASLNLRFVY